MLNLFIDTNVLLSFFSFSQDHLNKLDELVSLIKKKEIRLFLPEQVIDEFHRNRESKLKKTIEHLEKLVPKIQSPPFCQEFDEMKQIQTNVDQARSQLDALIDTLHKQISSHTLHPDILVDQLFGLGDVIEITDDIIHAARIRFDRGNPPGKNNSYGDAINWESLLRACPNNNDLYFVGGDRDFRSLLHKSQFSPYLTKEWRARKSSGVFYYELISQFTKEKFPDAKISDDDIKEEQEIATALPSVSGYSGYSAYAGPIFPAITQEDRTVTCSNCGKEFEVTDFPQAPFTGMGTFFIRSRCPHCGRAQRIYF